MALSDSYMEIDGVPELLDLLLFTVLRSNNDELSCERREPRTLGYHMRLSFSSIFNSVMMSRDEPLVVEKMMIHCHDRYLRC